MPFQKGESGNPAGRKPGSKNKLTEFKELFDQNAPAIIKKAIEKALEGDNFCLKLCLERISPAMKSIEVKGMLGIEQFPQLELTILQEYGELIEGEAEEVVDIPAVTHEAETISETG